MIVFGDRQRAEAPGRMLARLARDCATIAATDSAVEREEAALRLLVEAGELAQGVIDAGFQARGFDEWEETEERCAALTLEAARLALTRPISGPEESRGALPSQTGGSHPAVGRCSGVEALRSAIERLGALRLPETVTVKVPEGFAFYALDPELYATAARHFRAHDDGPIMVLGVRSIGTSLAAVVAVAAGAATPPATLRPVGHPFRRTLRVGPRLRDRLLSRPSGTRFALVDEGPGLSGSSLGAVADWLEDRGVSPEQIHFLPGHGGDLGPEACPRHRERWRGASRHVVAFEALLREGVHRFEADPPALEDIAGGKWRVKHTASEADWPPSNQFQERRKYLYARDGRVWMAKFAGLGRHGEIKRERARHLERAGWIAPVRGLRRGFLVEEWLTTARPLSLLGACDRPALREAVADYLAFRARAFWDADRTGGASPAQLLEMALVNAREWFGAGPAEGLERWRSLLPTLSARVQPLPTDNKMHAWEWLLLPDGRWVKADALDHAGSHDWIGPQDLAWDVTGAAIELDLDVSEQEALAWRVARASPYRPDPRVDRFHRECYLAFQMGYYAMAARAHDTSVPAEAARLRRVAEGYARRLGQLLDPAATA